MMHSIFVDFPAFEAVAEEIVPGDTFEVVLHEYEFHEFLELRRNVVDLFVELQLLVLEDIDQPSY